MNNWKRKIEYAEYDSSFFLRTRNVKTESAINYGTRDISLFRLAVSTAKSLITRTHVWTSEAAGFARSYIPIISFFIDDKSGYLALNKDSEKIVRDFSKTSRHGELAQGINYFIASELLGAIALYDFDYYVRTIKGITKKYKGRKPDFIMVYPNGEIGIIESKGTIDANPSSFLCSGHEQCEDGKNFLTTNSVSVKNSYVSAVSFATTSPRMTRNTKVYFADPLGEGPELERNTVRDRLYEYSKFFYLAGNSEAFHKLRKGEAIDEHIIYSMYDYNQEGIIAKWPIDKKHTMVFGISSQLCKYLCSPYEQYPEGIYEQAFYSEYSEQFQDGTYVKIIEE